MGGSYYSIWVVSTLRNSERRSTRYFKNAITTLDLLNQSISLGSVNYSYLANFLP